jgi:hypothetical protein
MSKNKLYAPSIDDILRWLGIEFSSNLPRPEIIEGEMYYDRTPTSNTQSCNTNTIEKAKRSCFEGRVFAKESIMFNGKELILWRRIS